MNDHYQLYQLYQETKPYTSTIWQTIYQTANQIIEEQMAYIQAQQYGPGAKLVLYSVLNTR